MTAKEKAQELIHKYTDLTNDCDCLEYMCICFRIGEYDAKRCALIVVNNIIKALGKLNVEILHTDYNPCITEINGEIRTNYESHVIWWNEVKQEIEKL